MNMENKRWLYRIKKIRKIYIKSKIFIKISML